MKKKIMLRLSFILVYFFNSVAADASPLDQEEKIEAAIGAMTLEPEEEILESLDAAAAPAPYTTSYDRMLALVKNYFDMDHEREKELYQEATKLKLFTIKEFNKLNSALPNFQNRL